jgi:hypothetical protein
MWRKNEEPHGRELGEEQHGYPLPGMETHRLDDERGPILGYGRKLVTA